MCAWDRSLKHGFSGLMRYVPRDSFPFPMESGIRLAVEPSSLAELTLSCQVLVSHRFPNSLIDRFQDVRRAIVLSIESPSTGSNLCIRLFDPHRRHFPSVGPNFTPSESTDSAGQELETTGVIDIPLTVEVPRVERGDALVFRALLREYVSNSIVVDLSSLEVHSYLGGQPHSQPTMGEVMPT